MSNVYARTGSETYFPNLHHGLMGAYLIEPSFGTYNLRDLGPDEYHLDSSTPDYTSVVPDWRVHEGRQASWFNDAAGEHRWQGFLYDWTRNRQHAWSVAAWLYPQSGGISGWKYVYAKTNYSNGFGVLRISNQTRWEVVSGGSLYPTYGISTTGTLINDEWHHYVFAVDATGWDLYIDGKHAERIVAPWTGSPSYTGIWARIGSRDTTRGWNGGIGDLCAWNRTLRGTEPEILYRNQQRLFEPRSPRSYFVLAAAGGGGGVSGTVSATLAAATLSADGSVTVNGSVSSTLADATLAAEGSVTVNGSVSATLADATLNADGSVSVNGQLGITLGDATLDAAGSVSINGIVATALAAATLDASGTAAQSSIIGTEVGMWFPSWDLINQSTNTIVADLSGNGNDGTMLNGETSDWVSDTTSGGTYAIKFDSAANERVQIPANDDVRINGDFSLSMWFRPDEKVHNRMVVSCGTNTNVTEAENINWAFRMRNSGGVNWGYYHEYGVGTNEEIDWTSSWSIGTWYNIILVRDTTAKTVSLYQNGTLVSTQGYTNNPTGGTTGLMEIGGLSGDASECLMRWDALHIYNDILSSADITTLSSSRVYGRAGILQSTLSAASLSASGTAGSDSGLALIIQQLAC